MHQLPLLADETLAVVVACAAVASVSHVDDAPRYKLGKHQEGIQARVIAKLREWGSITAKDIQELGTTDARKIISRLRKLGIVGRTTTEPNSSGAGTHARYHLNNERK